MKLLCANLTSRSPDEGKQHRDGAGEEESGESEVDEETEMMKKIMGFNKFDTTKVILCSCSLKSTSVLAK